MRDSIHRIVSKGSSSVLLQLAARIGNAKDKSASQLFPVEAPSVNLVEVSMAQIMTGVVLNVNDWERLNPRVKCIVVKACSGYESDALDLSRFTELEALQIGNNCFLSVSKVHIVGLAKLKSITVGESAFQGNQSDAELVIQNCPSLVSLTIGTLSFCQYKRMRLSGLNALETITVEGGCFREGDLIVRNMMNLFSISLGVLCFERSRHTVIESVSLKKG